MKISDKPSVSISGNPEENPSASDKPAGQSPYLKAILSGKIKRSTKVVQMTISDRLAAVRYIRESKWRHNLFG